MIGKNVGIIPVNLRPNTLGNAQEVWVGNTYTTIQAAIDSITDASANKPYVVRVPPGIYDETATLQNYVSLTGAGKKATRIERSGTNEIGVYLADQSVLSNLGVKTTGSAKCLRNASDNIVFWGHDVYLESEMDLVYASNASNVTGYFFNICGETNWDGFAIYTCSNVNYYVFSSAIELKASTTKGRAFVVGFQTGASSMEIYNTRVYGSGAFGGLNKIAIEMEDFSSTIKAHNLQADITNTSGSGNVYGVYAMGGTIEVYGGSILTAADTGTAYDLIQTGGTLEVSGTKYDPTKTSGVITFPTTSNIKRFAGQHTQVSVTGTTDEIEVFSTIIPGGALGPNGILDIRLLRTWTNNSNSKTMYIKFGGTVFGIDVRSTFGVSGWSRFIINRNNEAIQITTAQGPLDWGDPGGVAVTGTVDTSVDQTLQITIQLANAGDTESLEAIWMSIIRP